MELQSGSDWKTLIDFDKMPDGLVPAIVQDARSGVVLMLGYMDAAALDQSFATGLVTFFSRSKQRLWTKGESSGNTMELVRMSLDCDRDTLLVQAIPKGPVCHTGTDTCWAGQNQSAWFLPELERILAERKHADPIESYTARLIKAGIPKVAQKVGEEAVEVVIEALGDNKDRFLNESADLLYHFMVLLAAKDVRMEEVEAVLRARN